MESSEIVVDLEKVPDPISLISFVTTTVLDVSKFCDKHHHDCTKRSINLIPCAQPSY